METILNQLFADATYIITAILYAYYIFVLIFLIMSNREPSITLAWLAVLWFMPVFGLILYILFGRDWKRIAAKKPIHKELRAKEKKMMASIYKESGSKAKRVVSSDNFIKRMASQINSQDHSVPILGKVEILINGDKKFPRLMEDMKNAKKFIHMEYFIWGKDELTKKITDILHQKIKEGVEVRISYDWFGSLNLGKSEIRYLKKAGAKVYADVKSIKKINYRNHRKIVVIDKKIGYFGGLNMAQEYIDGGKKYPTWRDTHARVEGDFTAECQRFFADKWYEGKQGDLFTSKYFLTKSELDVSDPSVSVMQMADSDVSDYWESIRRSLSYAISNAEKKVWIQSPYFVPEMSYYDDMVEAALAGVDVRFMMTGWPDKKIAFNAARSYYKKVLKAGVKIYTYQKGFFHAKTMTVDGKLLTVGTTNIDIRSQKLHEEITAFIYDPNKVIEHDKIFEADMKKCHEVTLKEVENYTAWEKFRNSAARLFSNLL